MLTSRDVLKQGGGSFTGKLSLEMPCDGIPYSENYHVEVTAPTGTQFFRRCSNHRAISAQVILHINSPAGTSPCHNLQLLRDFLQGKAGSARYPAAVTAQKPQIVAARAAKAVKAGGSRPGCCGPSPGRCPLRRTISPPAESVAGGAPSMSDWSGRHGRFRTPLRPRRDSDGGRVRHRGCEARLEDCEAEYATDCAQGEEAPRKQVWPVRQHRP